MKLASVKIKGHSEYGQSRFHGIPKNDKETNEDHEKRTWIEKGHYNEDDYMFIPPTAFKNCLAEAAKFLSIQIPGKGKATYTKHFEAGVMVEKPVILEVKKDDVRGLWLHVPSDGKRGGTKRVLKCFPVIDAGWVGTVEFLILDETITEPVFKHHMIEAGRFIGLGFFRPRNNGYFGRFGIESIDWTDMT